MKYNFSVVMEFKGKSKKSDFESIPHLYEFFSALKRKGIKLFFSQNAYVKKCQTAKEEILVISDYREGFDKFAGERKEKKAAFVYYNKNICNDSWINGVDSCIQDFNGLDARYIQLLLCHGLKKAAEITETFKFRIREGKESDSEPLFYIRSSKDVDGWMGEKCLDLKAELEKRKAYYETAYNFFEYGLWTIENKKNGEIVGEVGLFNVIVDGDGKTAIGYYLKDDYRGHGYMKKIVSRVLKYSEEVLGLYDIYALVKHDNIASVKTLRYNKFLYYGEDTYLNETFDVFRRNIED